MKFAFLLAAIPVCFSAGQNLVSNPGFEEYYNCPGSFNINHSTRAIAPSWNSPTDGTPDLFNECSRGSAGSKHNWAGVSRFHSGKGYVGIYVWIKSKRDYREYIQTELRYPLVAGRTYQIKFNVKLSSYSRYSIDRIGALLLDSAYHSTRDTPINIPPTILKVYDSAFRKTTGLWEKISSDYLAKGNERYLIIGNFSDNRTTKSFHLNFEPVQEPMLANAAYYYVDDVSVVDADSINATREELVINKKIALNETFVLQNIQFEYNQATLREASFAELEKLVTILNENARWRVTIVGHTDDIGSIEFNQQLSEARANSVADFLITHGIEKERITTKGMGKKKPISLEKTETAKAKNRRVECTFSIFANAVK
jgi:OmpA-OmpF porin, OOP family